MSNDMEHLNTAAHAASAAGLAASAAKGAAVSGYVWPFLAGAVAAGIGFAVAWPKNMREGVSRIICTISTSVLAGEAFTAWVYTQPMLDFLPHTHKTELLLTVVAGLPAWWVLGWLFREVEKRTALPFPEIIKADKTAAKPE